MDQRRLRRWQHSLRHWFRYFPIHFGLGFHKRRNATLLIFGTYFIYHWLFASHLSPPQERWNTLMNFAQSGQFGGPPDVHIATSEEHVKVVLCNTEGKLCSNWTQRLWTGEELRRDEAWLEPGSITVAAGTQAVLTMKGGQRVTLSYGKHQCNQSTLVCQDIEAMDVQESIVSAIDRIVEACSQDRWASEPLIMHTIRPRKTIAQKDITMIAQFSVNRLDRFEHAMRVWEGPTSVVIYLQNKNDITELKRYFDQKGKLELYESTTLTIVKPDYTSEDYLRYPINHLRNIGILTAPTDYIFVIDADFVPTTHLYTFAKNTVIGLLEKATHPTAYVVPCVAIQESYTGAYPDTVQELQALMAKGIAYITDPRAGHGPTRSRLFTKKPLLGSSSKPAYEVCFESQWEPYYIVDRRNMHPYYDERFKDQGGDKQSHALLMNAIGFKFLVLRDHFIYHMDHPKLDWAGGGLKQNQKTKLDYTYFAHYAPALAKIFGWTYRWPRGCSQPLLSSSMLDMRGLGAV
ncbi:hypothetical protein BGZ73_004966 [Actinomortierella ambigua]|nr:hypothetical protein BGZ73_004966 [Actinomortierella ambigua]